MNKFTDALNFRHACKLFDDNKKIAEQALNFILEAGHKSPSSFGLEPWHFLVISDQQVKEAIRPVCWNQPQITTCSHLVVALFRKANQFSFTSDYLRNGMQRKLPANADSTALDKICQRFIDYCENDLSSNNNVDHWSEMQCYLAAANMMTAASYINIDSCPIGGFQYDAITEVLEQHVPMFNSHEFGVALVMAFGYRVNPQSVQTRLPQKDIFTFI